MKMIENSKIFGLFTSSVLVSTKLQKIIILLLGQVVICMGAAG